MKEISLQNYNFYSIFTFDPFFIQFYPKKTSIFIIFHFRLSHINTFSPLSFKKVAVLCQRERAFRINLVTF